MPYTAKEKKNISWKHSYSHSGKKGTQGRGGLPLEHVMAWVGKAETLAPEGEGHPCSSILKLEMFILWCLCRHSPNVGLCWRWKTNRLYGYHSLSICCCCCGKSVFSHPCVAAARFIFFKCFHKWTPKEHPKKPSRKDFLSCILDLF